MKKLIDIPEEIVKDLKKMAIDADKDLKNFIQDHPMCASGAVRILNVKSMQNVDINQ